MNSEPNHIIRPGANYSPGSDIFREMDKRKLKEFYQWFMASLPYCIEELMQLVASTPGFEGWEADDTPSSLDDLGMWFAAKVKKREFTLDEIEAIKGKLMPPIQSVAWDLTDETKSLALYVGMYYGEVALKGNPLLKWTQLLGNRKFADYGQPVVSGDGVLPINPVRVAHSIAHGVAEGVKDGRELRKAYDYWKRLATSSFEK